MPNTFQSTDEIQLFRHKETSQVILLNKSYGSYLFDSGSTVTLSEMVEAGWEMIESSAYIGIL